MMEEMIKRALLDFNWWDYSLDNIGELAESDPDVGVFDDLAAHISEELRKRESQSYKVGR